MYDDLKHVNYPMFVYVKYDKDINLFILFTKEEKELVEKIEQAQQFDPNYKIPNCLTFKELLESEDLEKIMEDLKQNHKLIYEYIHLYSQDDVKAMLTDFSMFIEDERKIIIKILENEKKNVSKLKD